MKKIILLIIVLTISLGTIYYFSTQSTKSIKEGALSSALFREQKKPTKQIETLFKDHEYRNAMLLLSKSLQKYELDGLKLQKKATGLPREEFLRELPEEVRRAYESLYQATDRLQKGINPHFTAETPKWIEERNLELLEVELDSELKAFVEEKKSWRSISNADLEFVIEKCQSERDCLEKSLKIWIDAGHHLNSEQYALIRKALL